MVGNRIMLSTGLPKVRIILYMIMILLVIATFYPALQGLFQSWYQSDDNSHGFLIIPCCIYFVWRSKNRWAAVQVKPEKLGAVALVISLCLYIFAQFAGISTLGSLSFIATIWSIVLFFYGLPMLKALIFPLSLLFLMIPIPAQLYSMATVPLQLFVSKLGTAIAAIFNIPILREGNVLHLPEHTLAVVQACSGLRSLMALITLSVIFGYMTLRKKSLRTILVLSAIPAAVLVNVVRIVLMIIAYYYFDIDLAHGSIHTAFGTVIFVFAIMIVFLGKRILSKWDETAIIR